VIILAFVNHKRRRVLVQR